MKKNEISTEISIERICENCKYAYVDLWELPCRDCLIATNDKWEPEDA